ncbi:MAG: protein kinase domain-containing protein [Opitutales bacterium]
MPDKSDAPLEIDGFSVKDLFLEGSKDSDESEPSTPPSEHSAHTRGRFGKFELETLIGEGGTGLIWKARQLGLDRWVAVKILKFGKRQSEEAVTRFLAEAETVSQLDHPHIAPIYDTGEVDGVPYICQKLYTAGSLQENASRLEKHHTQAAELVEKIAGAVHHAHLHGILHRDLKPSNVLLNSDDTPQLSDFGHSLNQRNALGLTQTGQVVGSLAYMAPEMLDTGTRNHTTAIDVYGLGAILYELITGQTPFHGQNTAEMVVSIAAAEPITPSAIRPDIHRDLETICLKCLRKKPESRYASAAAVADDLRRWLNGEPILARPISTAEHVYKWSRRNPALSSLIAVSVAATLGFIVFSIYYNKQLLQEKLQAEQATLASEAANDELNAYLKSRDLIRAEELFERRHPREGIAVLLSMLERDPDDRVIRSRLTDVLTSHPIYFLEHTSSEKDTFLYQGMLNPSGDTIIKIGYSDGLIIESAKTGESQHILTGRAWFGAQFITNTRFTAVSEKHEIYHGTLLPDGSIDGHVSKISYTDLTKERPKRPRTGGIEAWKQIAALGRAPYQMGNLFTERAKHGSNFVRFRVNWSHDFEHIAHRFFAGTHIQFFSTKTGEASFAPIHTSKPILTADLHSMQYHCTMATDDAKLLTYDFSSGELLSEYPIGQKVLRMEISPDDRFLAGITLERRAFIFDLETEVLEFLDLPSSVSASAVTIAPNSRNIAIGTESGRAYIFDSESRELITKPLAHSDLITSIEFSENDSTLFSNTESGNQYIWRLPPVPQKTQIWKTDEAPLGAVHIDPTGHIVLVSQSSKVSAINTLTGKSIDILDTPDTATVAMDYSADGSHIGIVRVSRGFYLTRILNSDDFSTVKEFQRRSLAFGMRFAENGDSLMIAETGRTAKLINWKTENVLHEVDKLTGRDPHGYTSEDGTVFVSRPDPHKLEVVDLTTRTSLGMIQSEEPTLSFKTNTQGSLVGLVTADHSFDVYRSQDTTKRLVSVRHRESISDFVFCNNERAAFTCNLSGTIHRIDLKTGESTILFSNSDLSIAGLAIDKTGSMLLASTDTGSSLLIDMQTGFQLIEPSHNDGPIQAASFCYSDGDESPTAILSISDTGQIVKTQIPEPKSFSATEIALLKRLTRVEETQSGLLAPSEKIGSIEESTFSASEAKILKELLEL